MKSESNKVILLVTSYFNIDSTPWACEAYIAVNENELLEKDEGH